MMRRFISLAAATAVLALAAGCGASAGPHVGATVPVKGKVTYKGQPISQGTVVFEPEDAGREAHGDVQPDGSFVLSTFQGGDGAVAGVHRVAVSGNPKAGKTVVPVKFRSPSSSKVQVEVSEGKTEYTIDFK